MPPSLNGIGRHATFFEVAKAFAFRLVVKRKWLSLIGVAFWLPAECSVFDLGRAVAFWLVGKSPQGGLS